MTPQGLQQLKQLYARELGTLGFKEVASGSHGWHVDAMFTNGTGGNFGFRLEMPGPGENPNEHHITIQANARAPIAGEVPFDFRARSPQDGVNYIRSLFLVAPGEHRYQALPTQGANRSGPGVPPQVPQRPQAAPQAPIPRAPGPVPHPQAPAPQVATQAPTAKPGKKGAADKVGRGTGGKFTKKK